MRVLTIISKLEMGGIEKTLLSCIPYLLEKGIKMDILCSLGGSLDAEYEKLGVKLIGFGSHKKPFKDAIFLNSILLKNDYGLVHSRYGHTSGLFAKVCYKLNIPILVSIHNEKAMFRNNWKGKPVLGRLREIYLTYHKNLTIKYASKIIGHSKANLRYYIPEEKINNLTEDDQYTILYNGVDFGKFENYPKLSEKKENQLYTFKKNIDKVFVHIGSFKEQKNHEYLISLFEKLNPIENKFGLILIGDGDLLPQIRNQVKNLGLENQVLFTGMEVNIAPYLYTSNIFIFPSLYEGFGNVLIEAQYCNLVIAASNILPHYEAVYNAYHRYFFSPNHIDEARNKLLELLNNSDNQLRINEAHKFAEKFSVENMASNIFEIYKNFKT